MGNKTYIGIDPGSKGFLVAMFPNGDKKFIGIGDHDYHDISEWLRHIQELSGCNAICCMEAIHAVFGSSAKATFSFGETFGMLQGILVALGIPYHLVPPKEWQKEIWISQDKVYKKGGSAKSVDNKPTSINAARRLFPGIDFRRTEKCKNIDDNKCDAILICEYGRRKNL